MSANPRRSGGRVAAGPITTTTTAILAGLALALAALCGLSAASFTQQVQDTYEDVAATFSTAMIASSEDSGPVFMYTIKNPSLTGPPPQVNEFPLQHTLGKNMLAVGVTGAQHVFDPNKEALFPLLVEQTALPSPTAGLLIFGAVLAGGDVRLELCLNKDCFPGTTTMFIDSGDWDTAPVTQRPTEARMVAGPATTTQNIFLLVAGKNGAQHKDFLMRIVVGCTGFCAPAANRLEILKTDSQLGADVFVAADGQPAIARADLESGVFKVKVAFYNVVLDLITDSDVAVSNPGGRTFGRTIRAALGTDGNPVVVFQITGGTPVSNEIAVVHCTTARCTSVTPMVIVATDAALKDVLIGASFPFISFRSLATGTAQVITCLDLGCAQFDTGDVGVAISPDSDLPMALDAAGVFTVLATTVTSDPLMAFQLLQDDNECLVTATCSDTFETCTNTAGSYVCECAPGFQLGGDGECSDVDECQPPAVNNCTDLCINTLGSFTCDCSVGFVLDSDGISCSPAGCPAFPSVLDQGNSAFHYSGCPEGNATEGTVCTMVCLAGGRLPIYSGSQNVTCLPGGTWSHDAGLDSLPLCALYVPVLRATVGAQYNSLGVDANQGSVQYAVTSNATAQDALQIDIRSGAMRAVFRGDTGRSVAVQITATSQVPNPPNPLVITFMIDVSPPMVSAASEVFAFKDQNFFQSVIPQVDGGRPPYTYAINSGSIPSGMTLNTATGAVEGAPSATGDHFLEIVAQDFNGATFLFPPLNFLIRLALNVTAGAPLIPPFQSGRDSSHDFQFTTTGGEGNVTYFTSAVLPSGISLRPSDGSLTGLPFNLPVDGSGNPVSFSVTFDILARDSTGDATALEDAQLTVLPRDDCETDRYGPNGQGCNSGECVDAVSFDTSFTCDCSQIELVGDNCDSVDPDVLAAQAGTGNAAAGTDFVLIGGIVGGMTLLMLLIAGVALHYRRKRIREANKPFDFEAEMDRMKEEGWVHVAATNEDGKRLVPREVARRKVHLLDKLGEGQFGDVFKGTVDESDTTGVPEYLAAVKTLKDDPSGQERTELMREACMMAQLKHRHVVNLIGVCTKGMPYLMVVQYCEHGALSEHLKGLPELPKLQHMMKMAKEIAMGMSYLSGKGLIHRDLAARNVLLDSQLACKVADFGLSKDLDDTDKEYYRSNKRGMIPVRWTAIEALEERRFSQQSDVWSWGITIYEILTKGVMPYSTMNNQVCWMKVRAGYRLPCPESCTEDVYAAIIKPCWHAEPADRPTFSELVHAIEQRYLDPTQLAAAPEAAKKEGMLAEDQHGYVALDKAASRRSKRAKAETISRHGTQGNVYAAPTASRNSGYDQLDQATLGAEEASAQPGPVAVAELDGGEAEPQSDGAAEVAPEHTVPRSGSVSSKPRNVYDGFVEGAARNKYDSFGTEAMLELTSGSATGAEGPGAASTVDSPGAYEDIEDDATPPAEGGAYIELPEPGRPYEVVEEGPAAYDRFGAELALKDMYL